MKNKSIILIFMFIFDAESLMSQSEKMLYFHPYLDFSKEISFASSRYYDDLIFENNILTFSPILLLQESVHFSLLTTVGYGQSRFFNGRSSLIGGYLGDFEYVEVNKSRVSVSMGVRFVMRKKERPGLFFDFNCGISHLVLTEEFFLKESMVYNVENKKTDFPNLKIRLGIFDSRVEEAPEYDEDVSANTYPHHYRFPVDYGATLFFERNQYFSYFGLSFFVGISNSIYLD